MGARQERAAECCRFPALAWHGYSAVHRACSTRQEGAGPTLYETCVLLPLLHRPPFLMALCKKADQIEGPQIEVTRHRGLLVFFSGLKAGLEAPKKRLLGNLQKTWRWFFMKVGSEYRRSSAHRFHEVSWKKGVQAQVKKPAHSQR